MRYAKELFGRIREDDVTGLSAELAYRFLFSLFPLLLSIAALSAFVARFMEVQQPTDGAITWLSGVMPEDAASTFAGPLRNVLETNHGGLLFIGILAALFSATSAMRALIKAMNRAYRVEEARSFWRQYALALGMTLLAGVALITAFVLLVAGQFFGTRLASELGFAGQSAQLINLARIPIVIVMLMVAMGFLYWALPAVSLPLRWVSAGGVTFVLVWLAATLGFAFYVQNFGNYNATYGALGGVIVLMLWLYITSFVMVLGAEINAYAYLKTQSPPSEQAAAPAETRYGHGTTTPARRGRESAPAGDAAAAAQPVSGAGSVGRPHAPRALTAGTANTPAADHPNPQSKPVPGKARRAGAESGRRHGVPFR